MIEKIFLENFKCFSELSLTLSALNIFSGLNGMGKSTTIQAILLLLQSYNSSYLPLRVALNGEYVSLGTGKDVLFEKADQEQITIMIDKDSSNYTACISYDADSDTLPVNDRPGNIDSSGFFGTINYEYLGANRIAPQVIYPQSSYYVNERSQLGAEGQYAVHYLYEHQDNPLTWNSGIGDENYLKNAVQFWLTEITPNIKIDIQKIENTDLTRIGYYYSEDIRSNISRPTNTGYGISCVLPVLIAVLKSKPGDLLLIENPEAHLHPRGQRKLGELLALCASAGVQLVVESHSDHVLNGVRIAVKKRIIPHENVNFFFFDKAEYAGEHHHIVEKLSIDRSGRLNHWPNGFFDEWEKALDEII